MGISLLILSACKGHLIKTLFRIQIRACNNKIWSSKKTSKLNCIDRFDKNFDVKNLLSIDVAPGSKITPCI